jgi:outer membrane protein assembly factor BamB
MKRMSILALIFCACHAPVAWGQQPAANGNSDWTQFHRTNMERWNPYEHFLNVKNVSHLSVKWRDPGDGYSSPAVANGVVYTGSSSGNVSARNAKPHSDVSALDAKTGARLWSYATGDNYLTSSPAVANGLVYFGPSGKGSTGWYALNARTGVLQWGYYIYDAEYSSAAVANGVVYVGAESAGLYAFDARSGALLWSYRTGNKDSGYTSPAVANGVVYFGSDNNVYAVNANTGVVLWTYAAGNFVESSPAVANGVVYVGSDDYNVYALNAKTGAKLWSYATGDSVHSSPAVANGMVYVCSDKVYAFGLK